MGNDDHDFGDEINADQLEAERQNYLSALWENFFVTRRPEDLAHYIEAGGEINDNVRQAIVRALRGEDKLPHGSSKILDAIEFYIRVRERQLFARLNGKKKSLENIFGEIESESNLLARGAKGKYDRGRIAARERLGIGKP